MLGEVPELVDFLFLEDAPDDPASWQKAIAGDEGAPRILADALAAYEDVPVGQGRAARGDAGHRGRRSGASWARRRRRSAWPSWGGPAGSRCSTRWPCWAATRRAAGWRPRWPALAIRSLMLLAPLRWALRIVRPRPGGDRPLLRRHAGAGLADLAPVRPAPGGRHPGHGGGAVRLRALPGPAGAARPGGDPLPPGLRPPDHADGQQAAGRQVHRGGVGRHVSREVKGVPSSAILEAGGNDSYENIADAQPTLHTTTAPRWCSSPPIPSTRTAPWPSRRTWA